MKIETKEIIILILVVVLVLSSIFRPNKPIETYENEIKLLQQNNVKLLQLNDSLKVENLKLNDEIRKILVIIDCTQAALDSTQTKINELENAKSNVSSRVRNLNADGVARELSEFLNNKH